VHRFLHAAFLAVLLLANAGCGELFSTDENVPMPKNAWPTILVENAGTRPITVRNDFGFMGRVWPGDTDCLSILGSGVLNIRFVIGNSVYHSPDFSPFEFDGGWYIRIGEYPKSSVTSLTSVSRCER
jgi:hypothetical protein